MHLSWILLVSTNGELSLRKSAWIEFLFFTSFTLSVISASLGMTRLLMNGPSKLIKKQGKFGGYAQCPLFILFLSIASCLIAKASWVGFIKIHHGHPIRIVVWLGISCTPQLLMVSIIPNKITLMLCMKLHKLEERF